MIFYCYRIGVEDFLFAVMPVNMQDAILNARAYEMEEEERREREQVKKEEEQQNRQSEEKIEKAMKLVAEPGKFKADYGSKKPQRKRKFSNGNSVLPKKKGNQ